MAHDLFSQHCTRRSALGLLAASAGIGLLGAHASAAHGQMARQPKRGGQLKIGQPGDLSSFEPGIQFPHIFPFISNVFDTVVQYDRKMVPQPHLVTAWEIARDGLSIKMTLRRGSSITLGAS